MAANFLGEYYPDEAVRNWLKDFEDNRRQEAKDEDNNGAFAHTVCRIPILHRYRCHKARIENSRMCHIDHKNDLPVSGREDSKRLFWEVFLEYEVMF